MDDFLSTVVFMIPIVCVFVVFQTANLSNTDAVSAGAIRYEPIDAEYVQIDN